jgi:hypothetical protein
MGSWMGSNHSRSGNTKQKNVFILPKFEPRLLSSPVHGLVAISTELSGLPFQAGTGWKSKYTDEGVITDKQREQAYIQTLAA